MRPPHQKLRIIVGGMVGQFPLGGVAWDYFHYVLGLHELGHEVYYHEDTFTWPFDPVVKEPRDSPDYSVKFLGDFFARFAPHLVDRWHYLFLRDQHFGMTAKAFDEVARTADVFLNVSGACFYPENLNPKCVKVFLDTDPGYNQIMLHERFGWALKVDEWCKLVRDHDRHLTYAENIYSPDCVIPRMDLDWQTTRCVVTLGDWAGVRNSAPAADAAFTTVMSWDWFKGRLIYKGVEYNTKVVEFEKFRDLPRRVEMPLSLVVGSMKVKFGPLRREGWRILDGYTATATPGAYQDLIGQSAGEWSVAKNVYVAMRSGWFSCRTACYLAAGRPAVVQETGWSKFVLPGDGLVAFNTIEEAVDGLKRVAGDPARHRAGAYEIAREYLSPQKVLTPMIDGIFSTPAKNK